MRKRQKNVHNFPVLQQDIPASHRSNLIQERKTVVNQTIPENNDDFGNFFDEIHNREENKKEGEPNVTEQAQKKEKKKLFTFKPDLLLDPSKGLKALYLNIDKYKLIKEENNNNPKFDEFHQLHKMMRLIKDWHFLCIPRYDFHYFLNRCQEFGNKPILKSHLTRMRKIHKGLMRWEDIENSENLESAIENNQNSFLPQELLNNLRNNNLNNAQNSNQNSKPINTSSNLIPTSQITNPINVNITTESIVKNDDFDEMNEENYEENFEEDIPAEIMNAPDIEVDVIEEDDVFDIETYELERDRKKIKNDEERTL